jgi:hypothetical protein
MNEFLGPFSENFSIGAPINPWAHAAAPMVFSAALLKIWAHSFFQKNLIGGGGN